VTGTEINTTVTVPDKGTVLLGGQRDVQEFEIEVGVPLLSKIPVVNRFFTNRITSKSESTLLLLIRPEIIIQQEEEDALFPGLRQQLSPGGAGF
jgi:type II secretory pathway component GspD/PulD (secretin)